MVCPCQTSQVDNPGSFQGGEMWMCGEQSDATRKDQGAISASPLGAVLFISEFIMIKTMLLQGHYWLCGLFTLLLTIILYGIGKVVIKTAFGNLSEDKKEQICTNKSRITFGMYFPQFVMLLIVFILGFYIPPFLNNIINCTVAGF